MFEDQYNFEKIVVFMKGRKMSKNKSTDTPLFIPSLSSEKDTKMGNEARYNAVSTERIFAIGGLIFSFYRKYGSFCSLTKSVALQILL